MNPLLPAHLVLIDALAELAVAEYLAAPANAGQGDDEPAPDLPHLDQAA